MSAILHPSINFDIKHIEVTEFGIGIDGGRYSFFAVPVDVNVQNALQDMVKETIQILTSGENGETHEQPRTYSPAERYGSEEYVTLPLESQYAAFVRQVHQADNLPNNVRALEQPTNIFCYFVRLRDRGGKRLTALRRATQFKGILFRLTSIDLQLKDDMEAIQPNTRTNGRATPGRRSSLESRQTDPS